MFIKGFGEDPENLHVISKFLPEKANDGLETYQCYTTDSSVETKAVCKLSYLIEEKNSCFQNHVVRNNEKFLVFLTTCSFRRANSKIFICAV